MIYNDLLSMGVEDVKIIGVGKDAYAEDLPGMINGRILPWVQDSEDDDYPVWSEYGAVQRSTYFLGRDGAFIHQFNITTLDPDNPNDYNYLINLILDYRSDNGPNVIRVPEEQSSIQSAIDIASDGDIVLVNPGEYEGQINFGSKNITLATLLYTGFGNEIQETILNGNGQGSVVTINGGQDQSTILLGFEIKNGYAEISGGGILIENSSPTIDRNLIHHNQSGSCGGSGAGIAILGNSYPYVFGNTIHNNVVSGECDCECYFGGGIYVDANAWPIVGGSMTLGNVFYDNTADLGTSLYRENEGDTTNWTPIYAHHNYFETCPPDLQSVYPFNGWDIAHCHLIDVIEIDRQILNDGFKIHQNYPNPFNATTTINFDINTSAEIELLIYDIKGVILFSKKMRFFSGHNKIQWNAMGNPSGVYFIRIKKGPYVKTQKAIFVK